MTFCTASARTATSGGWASKGIVGQLPTRRATIHKGNITGRTVLLAGQPDTGKTALAMGIANSFGVEMPFASVPVFELFSLDLGWQKQLASLCVAWDLVCWGVSCRAEGADKGILSRLATFQVLEGHAPMHARAPVAADRPITCVSA
ncbi:hypothetical protein E2562_036610 [Oryza meyeriana var. granulata]|uniref:RuvB-like helicase n=1 Tax=Oryza meyeriana var. granulata TaxID=110450 RepID=A0A6G1DAP2_9ORYZ|nr:hypothetical protein E2562_036610 [Oryza meyeriana var. granulata]